MSTFDQRHIRRAFSRSAAGYDAAAALQHEVEKRLLEAQRQTREKSVAEQEARAAEFLAMQQQAEADLAGIACLLPGAPDLRRAVPHARAPMPPPLAPAATTTAAALLCLVLLSAFASPLSAPCARPPSPDRRLRPRETPARRASCQTVRPG